MLWEGRSLRDIREADVRRLIESGLEEHLQLEYKSALYDNNERGSTEFLLDVCMFANAVGGIILIGVPERRDGAGQPTGAPDPTGVLGLELSNPGLVLSGYDARVMEAIEEWLPLESVSIDMSGGRRVLAIRVSNSANKPHSVQYRGHIYFPSRRERQRYNMTVREIKELVMRTASHLQRAEEILRTSFLQVSHSTDEPYLLMGMIPVFFEDFLVDVRTTAIREAVGNFSRGGRPQYSNPQYTFDGLERREQRNEYTVRFYRNGLLNVSSQLPQYPDAGAGDTLIIVLTAIDVSLRNFMSQASTVYNAAAIGAPFILGMMLRTQRPLAGAFSGYGGFPEHTAPIPAKDYPFPFMKIDDLSSTNRNIRPLCDQAHQMFGQEGSPSFNAEGAWVASY